MTVEEFHKSNEDFKSLIVAVIRGEKMTIPSTTFKFEPEDYVFFFVKSKNLNSLLDTLGVKNSDSKRVMIAGASKIGRIVSYKGEVKELPNLSSLQNTALENIKSNFDNHKKVLLHGVTGSGKTEIYIHLIQQQINQRRKVLYLLPEIAITTQIIQRLQSYFGNRVGIYHSRFSMAERTELWYDYWKKNLINTILF